jgi:hypothetical protein
MLTPVNAPTVGDPFFYGGFVGASHFLTGEHRTFNREDGHYVSKFVPRSPFGFGHAGIGAWEVSDGTRTSISQMAPSMGEG